MHTEIKFVETKSEFRKWNQLVLDNPCASFFITSHWFNSFTSFGMKAKYLIATTKEGVIVGGAALAIFKFGPMVWVQVPYGPVIINADENVIRDLVEAIEDYAAGLGAFLVETIPFEPCLQYETLKNEAEKLNLTYSPGILSEANVGISRYLVEHGYENASYIEVFRVSKQGQIVDLTTDNLLMSFRKGTRRDVRYSLDRGVKLVKVDSVESLRVAYDLLRENGKQKDYPVRPWDTFRQPLTAALQDKSAMVLMAEYQAEIISTAVIGFGGKRGSYWMGGTRRQSNERVCPAHFLQYMAMQETLACGYLEYDLTAIGNSGVAVFKRGFRPNYYRLAGSYTKVFRPKMLSLFLSFKPRLLRNRRRIADIVARGKSILGRF